MAAILTNGVLKIRTARFRPRRRIAEPPNSSQPAQASSPDTDPQPQPTAHTPAPSTAVTTDLNSSPSPPTAHPPAPQSHPPAHTAPPSAAVQEPTDQPEITVSAQASSPTPPLRTVPRNTLRPSQRICLARPTTPALLSLNLLNFRYSRYRNFCYSRNFRYSR